MPRCRYCGHQLVPTTNTMFAGRWLSVEVDTLACQTDSGWHYHSPQETEEEEEMPDIKFTPDHERIVRAHLTGIDQNQLIAICEHWRNTYWSRMDMPSKRAIELLYHTKGREKLVEMAMRRILAGSAQLFARPSRGGWQFYLCPHGCDAHSIILPKSARAGAPTFTSNPVAAELPAYGTWLTSTT